MLISFVLQWDLLRVVRYLHNQTIRDYIKTKIDWNRVFLFFFMGSFTIVSTLLLLY
jgi:hypothetical protein